ncbi:MAG: Grx4 family monothiol glutaredoxin [Deltaproteobacteria bacterium]|nr:Grx4 family monothiol glutaredoxin [Deltaproteobacteria bacterium]
MVSEDPVQNEIDTLVKSHPVVLFMKGTPQMPQCGFSAKIVGILDDMLPSYETVDVIARPEIRSGIKEYTQWPTVPQLYVAGDFVGGCDIITEMVGTGELYETLGVEVPDVAEPKIEITDNARDVFADAPCSNDQGIRLGINKQFQYELNVGPINAHDFCVESNGITLVIDRMSASRADGITIDFETDGPQSGFRIKNPNEPS